MSKQEARTALSLRIAALLSLVSGLLLIAGPISIGPLGWLRESSVLSNMLPPLLWPWPNAALGTLVALGGVLVFARPSGRIAYGIATLLVSSVVLLASAGGFIPGALGIAGGTLAVIGGPDPVSKHDDTDDDKTEAGENI